MVQRRKAYTFIELTIVVLILGIMAGLVSAYVYGIKKKPPPPVFNPAPNPYKKGVYANGIVDEARRAGMTIIGITVGRRDKDGALRALNAEELAEETLTQAWRALTSYTPARRRELRLQPWLFQIAANLARNRYWYWWRRRRDQTISFDQPVGGENTTTLAEVFPDELETPEDATVTQEFVSRVAECMNRLSPKHREILILRNVKNLSYEEIAEILGISVGTVKSRIARARDSLRGKMGDEFK